MSGSIVTGRPRVVAHVAVSLDGATAGFDIDVGAFYQLVGTWSEDLTLTGADTILAQESALAAANGRGPNEDGPRLAVVDGRGRVTAREQLRNAGIWSDVMALHAANTPPRDPDRSVREMVTGTDHVDLGAVLARVHDKLGVRTVRVDSGGTLIGALLDAGLLDEISPPFLDPAGNGRGRRDRDLIGLETTVGRDGSWTSPRSIPRLSTPGRARPDPRSPHHRRGWWSRTPTWSYATRTLLLALPRTPECTG